MIIETTLNLKKSTVECLNKASEITNRSRNDIIVTLLKRIMKDSYRLMEVNKSVRYQKKDPKKRWHRFHVQLNEYEYEFCLDMRKLFKKSVSFLAACAVDMYLNEIIDELNQKEGRSTDNYLYKNYLLVKEVIDNTICWRIYWEYRRK